MKTHMRTGALLLVLAWGCGPAEEARAREPEDGTALTQPLDVDNGLTTNGLAFNGLAFNGLAFNGLAFNGLSSASFQSWFAQNPLESNLFMKYLVRCAVPAGQTRAYAHGWTTYAWTGDLGLAPDWASGKPATEEEQEVVSACLAALTNKYARPVQVSVLGTTSRGDAIPVTDAELAAYSVREGCFFGNLFNGEGLFVGNDQPLLGASQSSLRACALGGSNMCAPLKHVGACRSACKLDASGKTFTECIRKGTAYHPLTTRLRPQDIYTCGDGVCQFPEVCGIRDHEDECKSDCGKCK